MTLKAQTNDLNLMPQPAELSRGEGRLAIDGSFRIALAGYQESRLTAAAKRLATRLSHQTGIPMSDELERDATQATQIGRASCRERV